MMYSFDRRDYESRMAWFRQARFGMFIHWGLYALPGRGEWVRSEEEMPETEYLPYFSAFSPDHYDPARWVQAAKEAGMQYVILTAKHHDGFCLFDSRFTDFKSTNTPLGRDIVRDFLDAARAGGLRAGLYYSLLDWHHPDYPHFGDKNHPMRHDPSCGNEGRDFGRYLDYMHAQVRELCENYGKLDLMWFDFSYDRLRGEAWRGTALADMVRSLQPGIILNNRMEVSGEGYGSLAQCAPTPFHGDFVTPEQMVPPEGLRDTQGGDLIWESCITMNGHWGYCGADTAWKPAQTLLKGLVECVSKGGNLLLNVGPDSHGDIPPPSIERLEFLGKWMAKNGESIYGCGKAGLPKPEYGRLTRKGNRLYYHLYDPPMGPLPLPGLKKEQIASIRRLSDGKELALSTSWVHSDYPDTVFVALDPPVLPGESHTVLEITLG